MDVKKAMSRISTARTAMQKADGIISACAEQERYSPHLHSLSMVQKEMHQQVGRLNLIYSILQSVEDSTPDEEDS